ncbi:hypothetical protein NL676_005032 [Syzygium grande]|nr:hypothetical protein NL676_005032 [Syzygium grande]
MAATTAAGKERRPLPGPSGRLATFVDLGRVAGEGVQPPIGGEGHALPQIGGCTPSSATRPGPVRVAGLREGPGEGRALP